MEHFLRVCAESEHLPPHTHTHTLPSPAVLLFRCPSRQRVSVCVCVIWADGSVCQWLWDAASSLCVSVSLFLCRRMWRISLVCSDCFSALTASAGKSRIRLCLFNPVLSEDASCPCTAAVWGCAAHTRAEAFRQSSSVSDSVTMGTCFCCVVMVGVLRLLRERCSLMSWCVGVTGRALRRVCPSLLLCHTAASRALCARACVCVRVCGRG